MERIIDPVKLASAKLPGQVALKLMDCLFDVCEMMNGNPSEATNSKDPVRQRTIARLDPERMQYIYGKSFST